MTFFLISTALTSILLSSLLYLYLNKKTRIRISYLYKDNLLVIILVFLVSLLLWILIDKSLWLWIFSGFWIVFGIPGIAFTLTMIRFWRTPRRKIIHNPDQIVSPADGNIIYVKKIEKDTIPISIKNESFSSLNELTKTDILKTPCWLIGINMTPFDVHKNCAPISGKVILNKHTNGKFHSLKKAISLMENERNTLVIENEKLTVGIIQIASKLIRRIDTYVNINDFLDKGEWFGMIRFGSQVDIVLPAFVNIKIQLGQQIFAGKTVIGTTR